MECNKDEAVRAITIAEGKFEKKDYAGAKKFALKAQSLYPGLEGISQLLATFDVYISAENKISGEVDWYGVLGVNPSADDEAVKKQYRKLVLMLHPDKNKSLGAEGAFKLISEAWSLLSDKAKRLAYNQHRSLKGYQQSRPGGPSAPPRANGFNNFTSKTASVPKARKRTTPVQPKAVPTPPKKEDTFWTICHRCKMHYEYLKKYLDHTLLCPNCHEAFFASETAPPLNYSNSSNSAARQQHQSSTAQPPGHDTVDQGKNTASVNVSRPAPAGQNSFTSSHQDPPHRTAGVNSMDPSVAKKAANVVQLARERLKREHDARHSVNSFSKEEAPLKKSRVADDGYRFGANMAHQPTMGSNGSGPAFASGSTKVGFEASRINGFAGTNWKPPSSRELTPLELRKLLMEKGRREVLQKLKEWRSKTATEGVNTKKEKVKETKANKERGTVRIDANGVDEAADTKKSFNAKDPHLAAVADANKEGPLEVPISVPDPDFHDFDLARTENSFGENEVWAAYDDDDGMPRFYALINKVISRQPFKLRLSWLHSKTNSEEFAPINWVGSGFYKTSGEFRVRKYEISKSINSFSHKVNWSKGPRGTIQIFPKRGEVWALYKNWSADWDANTPDAVIHKYEMAFVLDDYNEEQGISVAPLVKVAGFRTVFSQVTDPEKIIRVPKEEMFRFSHQVPNHLLTGEEAENAPKGCRELDPAATPVDLLKLTAEDKEVQAETENNGSANVMEPQNVTRVGQEIQDGFKEKAKVG